MLKTTGAFMAALLILGAAAGSPLSLPPAPEVLWPGEDDGGAAGNGGTLNFHFQQPQESRTNQEPVATVTEAFAKAGSDIITIKEIYRNTDTEESLNASYKGFSIRSRAYVSQSRSSGSIGSIFDDACNVSSAQLSSANEIIKEKEFSVLPNDDLKEKASVSAAYLPYHHSCDYQEHDASYDVMKKPRISKSKSENDIIISASRKEVRGSRSFTMLHSMLNP